MVGRVGSNLVAFCLLWVFALPASAAKVAIGRDQSLQFADPSIVRVEVLGAENVAPGDPAAVVSTFTGQGPCLTYVFEDTSTLNQSVRLALFDAQDNILGLPIVTVSNAYYNTVDAACGVVPIPNSPPVAVDDALGTAYVGANLLANDTDEDGDTLTASLATPPASGSVVVNPDGTFVLTPAAGFSGNLSFTYQVSDGTDTAATPGTVTLTVLPPPPPANEPPVAVSDNFGENYQGANVLANDSDPEGDPLTAVLVQGPENGSLTLNADGSFTYMPDGDFFGADSFTYLANDGELNSESAAVVSLSVPEPPNEGPVARDDDFGEQYQGANVLANDLDANGDPLSAVLETPTRNGELQLNADGSFQYTPDLGYAGPDSFTYRASDGEFLSEPATVSLVALLPDENLPPVAAGEDFGEDFENGRLLDNDLDPNRDPLIVVLVTGPEHGELTLSPDGSFSYLPFAGYAGPDSFTYKVRDRALEDSDGLESDPVVANLQVNASKAAKGGVTNKQDADGTSVLNSASPNELRVSRRIDQLCPALEPQNEGQADLLGLCSNLRAQGTTAKQALVALKAITPEELAAIGKAFRVLSFSRFRNIGARISRVREGSRGVSIAGLNLHMGDQVVHGRELDAAMQDAISALGMGASADETDELREYSRLGLYLRGDLNFGEGDETELESAFDFDAQTLTVGADYRITDNLFAGASVSMGQSDVEFADNAGETTTDNYAVAVYGSLYSGSGYLDGIVSYGWSDVETERNIVYQDFGGTVDRVAEGNTDGSEYYISLNLGYNFNWGGLNIDPLARFFYLDGEFDPFQESGAGGWDLDIAEQTLESTSLSAGGQISYTLLPSWGVLTPYLRVEYTREFEDSADGIRYRFVNDPGGAFDDTNGMVIEGDDPDTSYMVYGAGVTAQFIHGISGFVTYQALGSYDNLSGEIVSFGMRWEANF